MKFVTSILGVQKGISLCLFFWAVFSSCSKDPSPRVQFNAPQLDLHYDQQHQYTLLESSAEIDPHLYVWSCDDQTVGTVDEDGRFKARKVGKTIVRATSADGKTKVESNVTVIPYSTLFTEPVISWGKTQGQVRAEEKRRILEAGAYYLAFTGENPDVLKAEYNFTLEKKLSGANIFLKNDPETYRQAVLYLKERYPDYYSANNSVAPFQLIHTFFNEERTTQINFWESEMGNLVGYNENVQ